MSFRRDLYERVMHQKDFGKVKNKIYDILGWFVDYSISNVIAMEFPIGKGFFMDDYTCKYCNPNEQYEEILDSNKYVGISLENRGEGEVYIRANGEWFAVYEPKYCPECGRKLL